MGRADRRNIKANRAGMGIGAKVALCLAIIIVVAYGCGAFVFSNRFNLNTKLNGEDVSMKKVTDVAKKFDDKSKSYKLKVVEKKGNNEEIVGSDINLRATDVEKDIRSLKSEQSPYLWFTGFFVKSDLNTDFSVTYDKAKLDEKVAKFKLMGKDFGESSKSAYPEFDEKEGKFKVHPEIYGNKIDKAKFNENLDKSLRGLRDEYVIASQGGYILPINKKDNPNIKKAIDELDKYAKVKVEYDFGYEKTTLDGKNIANLFDIDIDKNYDIKLSKDRVREYVRGLSRKYSTYGDTRTFKSATGKELTVSGGVYGWLIDREKETDALYKLVSEKKSQDNREPIYYQRARYKAKDDMGNTFVEISIAAQTMWYVKDGQVMMSTPIVTGDPTKGHATPTGIYPVNYKQRGAVLRGQGYASPVSFWVPFNGNVGIHDAPWKGSFGGSNYLGDGSRGCINTPYSKMSYLFGEVKEGDPVIVY